MIRAMAPAITSHDATDLRLAHTKSLGQFVLADLPLEGFNFRDLEFGQFRAPVFGAFAGYFEAIAIGVKAVFACSAPFQIAGAIVGLVPISVINLMLGRRSRAKKGVRYQSVYGPHFLDAVVTQHGTNVATPSRLKIKHAARKCAPHVRPISLGAPAATNAGDSSHAAKIRNFVGCFVTNSRAPNLFHAHSP